MDLPQYRHVAIPLFTLAMIGCGPGTGPQPDQPTALPPTAAASATAAPAASVPAVERWSAAITAGLGRVIDVVLTFNRQPDGSYTGTMDIPDKKIIGLPLKDVHYAADRIKFTLPKPNLPEAAWEHYDAKRSVDGGVATGQLTVGGVELPFSMKRLAEGEVAEPSQKRPQTPKPPFPYQQRELSWTNPNDGVKLAGTLTFPKGGGKHPALVMITGSGAQDRDESLLGHKPFLVIADHLTRHGFAVLRYDDRGVGGSTGNNNDASLTDKGDDALAGVALLKTQPEIDPTRIGLIGHSEGGIVAPQAAARSKDVAFVVMLGGTGVSGDQVMYRQKELITRAGGVDEATIKKLLGGQRKLLDAVLKDLDDAALRKVIEEVADAELALAPPEQRKQITPQMRKRIIDNAMAMLGSKSGRSFVKSKPAKSLSKLKVPVLALIGALDLQVAADENLAAIEAALKKAGNKDATVAKLDGINHVFQRAKTGMPTEYAQIETTIEPEVLNRITAWLMKRNGMPK